MKKQFPLVPEWHIRDTDGNFRFTPKGMKEEGAFLLYCGINPESVKTWDQYLTCKAASAPCLTKYLAQLGDGKSIEEQLVSAISSGDDEKANKLRFRLRVKLLN